MNGGGGKTVRSVAHWRLYQQNRVLNTLRLAYFLSPQKLKAEGLRKTDAAYVYWIIEKLYKSPLGERSLPLGDQEAFSFDIKDHIGTQRALKRIYKEKARKVGASGFLTDSSYIPNNTTMVYAGRNIKAEPHFKKFVQTVITFQDFALKKEADASLSENSYLDHLQKTLLRMPAGYERTRIERAMKAKREKMATEGPRIKKITDKDIARSLYGKASPQTLQQVRQTRKRLKGYNLL